MKIKVLIRAIVVLAAALPFALSAVAPAANATRTAWPVIHSVSPGSGPIGGGTSVTITGADLTAVQTVLFGGVPSNFVIVSSSEIIATSPSESAGTVYVQVAVGTYTSFPQYTFTYS